MSDKESSGSGSYSKHRRRRISKLSTSRSGSIEKYIRKSPIPEDLDSVSFLSSPKKIFDIISVFDERKRTMIQSIGFGGILSIPFINNENKDFSLWLLNNMKWYYGTISVGEKYTLTLTPEVIGKITGLTFSGADIADNSLETITEKLSFMKSRLSFLDNQYGIVQGAENYVQEDLPFVLDNEVSDNFKIAFVIFLIGRFLAPSFDHPDGNTNFWGALQNPAEIASFNWSQYVLANLKDAARLLNWVIPSGKTLRIVSGCMLILQIFYLDHIDFGDLNLPSDVFPRWSIFSNDHLDSMIKANSIAPYAGSSKVSYGRIQEIRGANACYGVSNYQSAIATFELSRDMPVTQINEYEYSEPFLHTPSSLPTIFKETPSFNNDVLDFAKFIRDKYQGKVDNNLLDDLKIHNARCLNHIYKNYRSMAASIVNENAKLAQLLIELSCIKDDKSTPEQLTNSSVQRRRRYYDFISGTDSSTEGEENTSNSKIPKPRLARAAAPDSSSLSNTNSLLNLPERSLATKSQGIIDGSQLMNLQVNGSVLQTKLTSFCHNKSQLNKTLSPLSVGLAKNREKPLDWQANHAVSKGDRSAGITNVISKLPITSTPKTYTDNNRFQAGLPAAVSASPGANDLVTKRTQTPPVPTPAAYINHAMVSPNPITEMRTPKPGPHCVVEKFRGFDTPEPSIKMKSLSPDLSPTTENKLFSGACVALKILDSTNEINLNLESFETEYNHVIEPKKVATPGRFSSSHWSKNLDLPEIDKTVSNAFYDWVTTTTSTELDRNWVIHDIPRFIKLSGFEFEKQLARKQPMSFDLFDIAIRRLRQLDEDIYRCDVPLRWRHLLESDYAMHVLGDENPVENKSIRDQFVGSPAQYEVSNCQMFYVPVCVNGLWWCYAWDLKSLVVYIIDPSLDKEKEHEVLKRHSGTLHQLSKSLTTTVSHLFSGWEPQFMMCKTSILPSYQHQLYRNESGIFTLFCIRYFDGQKLVRNPSEVNLKTFREQLFYELMEIKENIGRPPAFVQIIE